MFFDINPSNGVPVYEQVSRQVKFAIANGAYEAGQMIPSVREMARNLAINPNTVARAYRQLQDEQVIEAVRGSGIAVSRGAKAICRTDRTKLIKARIAGVLAEAVQSQLAVQEIQQIVTNELQRITAQ